MSDRIQAAYDEERRWTPLGRERAQLAVLTTWAARGSAERRAVKARYRDKENRERRWSGLPSTAPGRSSA